MPLYHYYAPVTIMVQFPANQVAVAVKVKFHYRTHFHRSARIYHTLSFQNALNDRVSGIDESVFVTWQGLEEALTGVKQELQPKERVVIEMANQTSPVSNQGFPTTQGLAFDPH